jgi:GT2 family glycosyltransferase
MKLSVIILNWNGDAEECVAACQSALAQTFADREVIFVDNGSTNDSTSVVQQRCPAVRVIYSGSNLGVAAGRNFGAAAATGEILFFLENDGVWESNDFLQEAVALFDTNPDMAVMYNTVVGFDRGELQSHTIALATPELVLVSRFSGGACAIRRAVFERLGGFPGDFFRQGEERFFALRVYDANYKVCYWTKYRLLHRGSSYTGKNTAVMRFNFENELKTVARLFPTQSYRQLFWLKLIAWLPRFIAAGDVRYLLGTLRQMPRWLAERSHDVAISPQTLALTEAIMRGEYRERCARQIDIRAEKQKPLRAAVVQGFLSRWLLRRSSM